MNNDQNLNNQEQNDPGALPSVSSSGVPRQGFTNIQDQISSLPPEANDIDLIEKEWVTHLKYIVSNTSEDPFTQQSEISKAKADYMRKRYNRDVKLSEG